MRKFFALVAASISAIGMWGAPARAAETQSVTVHFQTAVADERAWEMWVWVPPADGSTIGFTSAVDSVLSATFSLPSSAESFGLIFKTPGFAEKDISQDRLIELESDGVTEVWFLSGSARHFYTQPQLEDFTTSEYSMPDWARNAVMYEVNVRQYSEDSSFRAVQADLPRLKSLGVDIIWLMPIHPISVQKRKGELGSYYAVDNYLAVNPEFGSMADFEELVEAIHAAGMKVILDWVPNHTGWGNSWLDNEGWFVTDGDGNVVHPRGTDWTDVAELNFDNAAMRTAMIAAMKFWVASKNVDGFRVDHAAGVPQSFHEKARIELEKIKPVLMLAEDASQPGLLNTAFNMNYGWPLYSDLKSLSQNGMTIENFVSRTSTTLAGYLGETTSLNFVTNHDENSWFGTLQTHFGTKLPSAVALTYLLPGIPLVYSGQESGFDRQLKFFEHDPIAWDATLPMYGKLGKLKDVSRALAFDADYELSAVVDMPGVLRVVRRHGDSHVEALLNFGTRAVVVEQTVADKGTMLGNVNLNFRQLAGAQSMCSLQPGEFCIFTSEFGSYKRVFASKISGLPQKLTLKPGALRQLRPVAVPKIVSEPGFTYKSSRPDVVSVTSAGKISARIPGFATVTARSADGNAVFKVRITVSRR